MKILKLGTEYCKQSDWKILAALKFCMLSVGIIIGVLIPEAWTYPALIAFGFIFILTYIPLMMKLYKLWKHKNI